LSSDSSFSCDLLELTKTCPSSTKRNKVLIFFRSFIA
jgi:hypothetical protein